MTRSRTIFFAIFLLLGAVLAFLPLRAILGGDHITARAINGTIWDGTIRDLRVGKLAIGDVNARLEILPLLLGRARISISRGDAPFAPGITGSVTRRLGGFSLDLVNASLVDSSLLAPLPVENIVLEDFSARFIAGRCAETAGAVRLTLASTLPGLDMSAGMLARPRCERGKLLIPFVSQSAMEHLDIRLTADGQYTATIFLERDRTDQMPELALLGFSSVARGYKMVRKGRL
ncbi:MAG: type II secretion system protein N [Sphingorhabdus sp.]